MYEVTAIHTVEVLSRTLILFGWSIFTLPREEVRSTAISVCVSVCLSVGPSYVCPLAYLRNRMSKLHEIFRTCYHVAVARSFSNDSAMRYSTYSYFRFCG